MIEKSIFKDGANKNLTHPKEKQGISLIVLVITIVVMIILAVAVVLTLSNSGIISKANDAVDATDLANVQDLASMLWAEAYLDPINKNNAESIKDYIIRGLKAAKIDEAKYNLDVTLAGVTVTLKSGESSVLPIEWNSVDVKENTTFKWIMQPFVKISEYTLTATELANTEIMATMGEGSMILECVQTQDFEGVSMARYDQDIYVISVTKAGENATLGVNVPETGFYVLNVASMGIEADFAVQQAPDTQAPYVVVKVTESTTNKAKVEVIAKDNGLTASGIKEYRYYIKESEAANYELKATTSDTTYTFTSLNADKNYNIMVEVEDNLGYIGKGRTTKGSWVTATVDTVPIPKGFVASPYEGENTKAGGLVIYELNVGETAIPSTETKQKSLTTRNQYVWVPVSDFSNFIRQNFGLPYTISNTIGLNYWEVTLNLTTNMPDIRSSIEQYMWMSSTTLQEIQNMYDSIKAYKGFYIARYEAGVDSETNTTILTGLANVHSKMGKIPYDAIPWTNSKFMNKDEGGAVEVARSLYPETNANYGVVSTLTYGVQWDRTLAWWTETDAQNGTKDVTISSETDLNTSTNYGNYENNEILIDTFNEGAKYSVDDGGKYSDVLTDKPSSQGWVLTTGATEETRVNNIYDMAGNLYEWTMEGDGARIVRGGLYGSYGTSTPVSYRYDYEPDAKGTYCGFRPSLYIKK